MRKRVWVAIALILVLISSAALLYLNQSFFPTHLKSLLIEKAQDALKRRVTLEEMEFHFFKGFTLKNLTIFERVDSGLPFVKIKEINCSLLWAPLLQHKKIMVSSLKITEPQIHLARLTSQSWNFSDLMRPQTAGSSNSPPDVYLGKLVVTGGTFLFSDLSGTEPFTLSLENLQIHAGLSLKKGINFSLAVDAPKRGTTLWAQGDYSLLGKKLSAQIKLNNLAPTDILARYVPTERLIFKNGFLNQANLTLEKQGAVWDIYGSLVATDLDAVINNRVTVIGNLETQFTRLATNPSTTGLKSDLKATGLSVRWGPQQLFKGDVTIASLRLQREKSEINLTTDATVNNAFVSWRADKSIQGHWKSNNTQIKFQDGALTVLSDVILQQAKLSISDTKAIEGDLQSNQLVLQKRGNQYDITGSATLENGIFGWAEGRKLTGSLDALDLSATILNKILDLKTSLRLNNGTLAWREQSVTGNPEGNLKIICDPQSVPRCHYTATLDTKFLSIQNVPIVETIDQVSGTLEITNNIARTQKLSAEILSSPVEVVGSVKDFSNPYLDVSLQTNNFELARLRDLLPRVFADDSLQASGQSAINATYAGALSDAKNGDLRVDAELLGASIKSVALPLPVQEISGKIHYEKNYLSWSKIQGQYDGNFYRFNGDLTNFSRPVLKATLEGDQFLVTSQINLLNDAFQFVTLQGQLFDTTFDVRGDGHLLANRVPDFDLRGRIQLQLKDLSRLFPQKKSLWEKLDLTGDMFLNGGFKGTPQDWENWNLILEGRSDALSLFGVEMSQGSLRFEMLDQNISKANLSGKVFNGDLKFISSLDLRAETIPYKADLTLLNVDLSKLKDESPLKTVALEGKATGFFNAQGMWGDWKNATGNGNLEIIEGRLGQVNLLKGLGKFIFIPEYHNIVFTEGTTNLELKEGFLHLNEFALYSEQMNLLGDGTIDFDGNIKFDITSDFSPQAIMKSPSLKKTLTAVLTSTDNYLNIKVTGTLKDPEYNVTPTPVNVLEKTRDLIKEGLQTIF